MPLCDACIDVARQLSAAISAGYDNASSNQFILHRSIEEVFSLVKKCRLCAFLAARCSFKELDVSKDFVLEVKAIWAQEDRHALRRQLSSAQSSRHLLRYLHLIVKRKTSASEADDSQNEKLDYPKVVQVFACRESKAASTGSVWCRYRLPNTGSDDALTLMSSWLENCVRNHKNCTYRVVECNPAPSEAHILPTRIIDVGPADGCREPRLCVPSGKTGRWTALSHCWGVGKSRPLETTTTNLQERLKCIPMQILPQTFQDAVKVTRRLGLRYLWIDSLCILQDDREDWKHESASMGLLYRRAHITLLAGHSTDCSGGCFADVWKATGTEYGSLLPFTSSVELPYLDSGGTEGSFYLADKDEMTSSKAALPLLSRGWVFQEWALARRSIIFLKDRLIWSCRELTEDDRGQKLSLERPGLQNWLSLAAQYSEKALTFPSDRLPALQGISNIVRLTRSDTYFAGTWTADLPDALLWMSFSNHEINQSNSHLPSWTWAQTSGAVGFQLTKAHNASHSPSRLETVSLCSLHHSGDLEVECKMKEIENHVHFKYKKDIDEDDDNGWHLQEIDTAFMKRCFEDYAGIRRIHQASLRMPNLSIVLKPSGARLGWARWDHEYGSLTGPIFCLLLKLERNCIIPVLALPEDVSRDAYHVLYVVQAPNSARRFHRVGIGCLICDEWTDTAPVRKISLS